ncbi:hypothetical protein [Labrenzia sp. OB1]|uniref:hypothetical protein n=1 Tax=Labrenzia sp. OB1 TaxID=1561204 RepID=UPI0012E9089D|nr:hypothetical protein [Labrenzia sp. OB1]
MIRNIQATGILARGYLNKMQSKTVKNTENNLKKSGKKLKSSANSSSRFFRISRNVKEKRHPDPKKANAEKGLPEVPSECAGKRQV